jgi:iron complex outermembrane receptor protein
MKRRIHPYRTALTLCAAAMFAAGVAGGIAHADTAAVPSTRAVAGGGADNAVSVSPGSATGSTATAPSASHDAGDLTDLSLEELMDVQVTSVSKTKESMADAPAAVTVIDQDTIARSGFSTIPDLLRLVPGMDVARINSYTWAISSRGLNAQFAGNLLVLQDGRSVYTPIDGGVYWNTVDYVMQDLDRIEVIRGPGATLWGSNAVNGVVNITSKDARDTQGWLVSGRGGNDDSDLVARYGGKISDDTFYRVYFKGKYDNGFPDTAPALQRSDTTDDWYSGRGGFRIDKHTSNADTYTLQGDLANDQLRQPMAIPVASAPFSRNVVWNGSDTTGNGLGRWTHRFDPDSDFSLQMYYDYLEIAQSSEDFSQNTVDIDFNDRFKLGTRNQITWGTGYRFYRSNDKPNDLLVFVPPKQVRNLYNIFLQDQIAVVPDRLFLTVGSKLEHNDFTGFELEPGARLLWTPNPQNSVWASVSRATEAPSLADTDLRLQAERFEVPNGSGAAVPAEATVEGNPDHDSEKLVAYEAGYRIQPTKRVSIDLSVYYNNYTRLESLESQAPRPGATVIFPSTFANNIRGDTYGGEIAANLQVTDRWRLAASYSLLHATFERVPGSNDTTSAAADAGSSPRNQAQLHSYWDITRRLHFNTGVYFTGSVPEYNVPAFTAVDLNVMWEPVDAMEVTVGVMNLLQNRHPEFGTSYGQGFADQVPRTIFAQFSYRF